MGEEFQPPPLPNPYPQHNKIDFGIEQDFPIYLVQHPELVTDDPAAADWHYLPIWWTRYQVGHDFQRTDRAPLQAEVEKRTLDAARTFTIVDYSEGPYADMPEVTQFVTSNIGQNIIDVPLLCDPHPLPFILPKKRWLASFAGVIENRHPIREEMQRVFGGRHNFEIHGFNIGTNFFVNQMLESYVALAPRGYGCTSYRFYEALQLGVCPILISDVDNRPFKKWIDWDTCSAYAKTVGEVESLLENTPPEEWLRRGERAARAYREVLAYGQWCRYVLKELEDKKEKR